MPCRVVAERPGRGAIYDRLRDLPDIPVRPARAMGHVPAVEEGEFDGRRFLPRTAATGAMNRRATAKPRTFRQTPVAA
jgi:hypothetical protein